VELWNKGPNGKDRLMACIVPSVARELSFGEFWMDELVSRYSSSVLPS
jgi:hypothetical protein